MSSGPGEKSDGFQPEELLPIGRAARLIPGRRQGKSIYVNTVWRWCVKGIKGIKLKSKMVGGQRCTTRRWLREFFEELSALSSRSAINPPRPRTPGQRQAASERAKDELKAAWERLHPPF
jgi:hypothetical protein